MTQADNPQDQDERTRLLRENEALRKRISALEQGQTAFTVEEMSFWESDLLRLVVENAQEYAIFTVDVKGRVITWNQGAERLFGYQENEIFGQDYSRFFTSEDASSGKPAKELERARIEGKAEDESWRVRKDGTRFLAHAVMTSLRDRTGQLRGFSRIVRDITERKRAEQALRESEQRFRLFMDNSPAVTFIKDADGCLLYVDAAWKRHFPAPDGEWIGRTDTDLWPAKIARKIRKRDSAALIANSPIESLETLPSVRGKTKWLFFRFAFEDAMGNRLLGGTGIDVTEQEQAKDEIRRLNLDLERRVAERTSELTVANEELDAFCYSVSHDLRAPLRGIDGFSQAVLEDYADQLDDVGLDYLHRVRAEAQRMGQLIDDLLELSRVSRTEFIRRRVDMSGMAVHVAEATRRRDPRQQVDFIIADGLLAEADERLIQIVLENLLGNAWKFTSKRPEARIEFGVVPPTNGEEIWFVRDNGVGFDMAYSEHLFGAFQRLHGATEFPGTGIGLATVQRIIHRHKGKIWAQASLGEGATFYFTLGAAGADCSS